MRELTLPIYSMKPHKLKLDIDSILTLMSGLIAKTMDNTLTAKNANKEYFSYGCQKVDLVYFSFSSAIFLEW